MKHGVVWLDQILNQANVNPAAAHLLGLPAGEVPAGDFIAAMKRLEGRALNRSAPPVSGSSPFDDLSGDVELTLCFAEAPTRVHVSSYAGDSGGFTGSVWAFDDSSAVPGAPATSEAAYALLLATTDVSLDPQVLLEAVTDSSGQIVDFLYCELNQATCDYLGLSRAELLGRGVVETMPGIKGTLLPGYIRCLDSGEPLILDDFAYDNEVLHDIRRYDLRATRATATSIVLTWRDVTERFHVAQRAAKADERYRRSMDHAAIGMCLISPDGRFEEINDALCQLFGYDADTLKQKTWQELTAPEYLESDLKNVNDVLGGRIDSYRMTKQYIHAEGHPIWGDLSVSCIRDEHGQVENFISQITDITARVEADERNRILAQQLQRQNNQIAASEQNYRLLVENTADVVCHLRDDMFVWVSPNVEQVLGAPAEHWVGRRAPKFIPPEDAKASGTRPRTVNGGRTVKQRARIMAADGATHWIQAQVTPFYDAEGHRDGAVAAFRLVDDEVAAEQALEEARRQQAKTHERYRRSMDHAAVGMCLLTAAGGVEEVNHALCQFFGHDGDSLKQKTWQELTGPEYMEANLKNVNDILEGRIDSFRLINQYINADGHLIWGDQSVSCIRDEHGHVENFLIQINDVTAVERELRERLEFEEFIADAISEGRLVAYAQPIIDARTGQVVEEELLVRLVGPGGHVMVPGEFLPQAQRFGTMATIDRFMVARGIELATAGRRVAVNLSAGSINDAATIAAIVEDLRQAGDAAARVSFEITETTALASTDLAEQFSNDMRTLGCRLALDDFGTGFGTFTELRGMTLDTLKIDQSFVHDLLRNPQDESVVRAIVGIAGEFGLLTTAEGVEDADTRTRLVELGVDQLQGYFIGRPAPATPSVATND